MTEPAPAWPQPPLIAHVLFRFDIGGLENGLVNLINRMPADRYRHAVVSLEPANPEFQRRLSRPNVPVLSIHKRPGKDLPAYGRMWRTLRRLRPAIVHTRNIGTLDMQWVAAAAGVRHRVHGEHGWNPADPLGVDPKNLRFRRACRPVVQRYVAMSRDIARWLEQHVGVPADRIRQLYSGVDSQRFTPSGPLPSDLPWRSRPVGDASTADYPPSPIPHPLVIGAVGRLDPIKNHAGLLQAFARILDRRPDRRSSLRMIIVGDGAERARLTALVNELRLGDHVWLPGARSDAAELMRAMDVFVLPSINEGISNTILEAMASGLPVVANRVGGNPELVVDGVTGLLCDAFRPDGLENAVMTYVDNVELRQSHGTAGRERVIQHFSLDTMVRRYLALYDELRFSVGSPLSAIR